MCMHRRFPLSELPTIDLYAGREQDRDGDRAGAIRVIRKSVDDMFTRGQVTYCVPATGFPVEVLLDRGDEGDVAEAEHAIARLAAAPADGSVIRDVWLLRLSAQLALAHGDEAAYRDYRDRYSDMAASLGFEGLRVGRGDAMTADAVW
jgi:adenylate cyclase